MKHGYIVTETFAGREMHPKLRGMVHKIGLSVSAAYVFEGYRSSILRHMIDTRTDKVIASTEGHTIQVKINTIMKSGGEQIIDQFRGAALGFAGGFVTAVDAMNTVLDGVSVLGYINDALPEGEGQDLPELKRPGKSAYAKDHMFNDRISVRLECRRGKNTGWIDTQKSEISLEAIAYLVKAS